MRILLTTDTVGGVWTFTQELATELLKRGHAVALLSFGREPAAGQSAVCVSLRNCFGERFLYEASEAPLEWMESNERAYPEGVSAVLHLVDSFRADLVHSNQFCFGDLPLSIPVVITAHSDVLSWAAVCLPQGLEPSVWLDRYVLLVTRGLERAASIVAPTRWMGDALCQHYDLTPEPRIILNGRNSGSQNEGTKKVQAVSVGRLWDAAKNVALLREVDCEMRILVAGEQRFEQAEASCGGNLTFLGELTQQQVVGLFRESSIYLAPSRYEPFGLAPLEAAQCGCALLLNDLPSFREIWGDSALYFNDAGSLSRSLAQLSPESLYEAQKKSQARARQLTATRMAEQYELLYSELLASPSKPLGELATHVR